MSYFQCKSLWWYFRFIQYQDLRMWCCIQYHGTYECDVVWKWKHNILSYKCYKCEWSIIFWQAPSINQENIRPHLWAPISRMVMGQGKAGPKDGVFAPTWHSFVLLHLHWTIALHWNFFCQYQCEVWVSYYYFLIEVEQ